MRFKMPVDSKIKRKYGKYNKIILISIETLIRLKLKSAFSHTNYSATNFVLFVNISSLLKSCLFLFHFFH